MARVASARARAAGSLSEEELDRLRRELRAATRSAIRKGGVHTGDVHRPPRARRRTARAAARRSRARHVGGRTTYWCPAEQV